MKRSPIKRKPPSPRKQLAAAAFKKERARIGKLKGNNPIRSRIYLNWLKSQRCCVPRCWCKQPLNWGPYSYVDPCHVGPHALSVKSDDTDAVPLCRYMHEKQGADRFFFEKRKMDLEQIRSVLRVEFTEAHPKEAERIGIA